MNILLRGDRKYQRHTFGRESDFEAAVAEVTPVLFGSRRIYLDVKSIIGKKGKKRNIPDGYLLDLLSSAEPRLYVVENELSRHDPLRHIAVQLLEFSLSFEQSKRRIKQIIYNELLNNERGMALCKKYAKENGFRNVDHLLETMVFDGEFRALVIIDETIEELETVLKRKLGFPVEVIELFTFKDNEGNRIYQFTPFLAEVLESIHVREEGKKGIDIAEVDTVVVPAREDGFNDVFLGEDCWYKVRIHASMIEQIKYIAAYQVAPISAITHVAPVKSVEPYKDSGKVIIYFEEQAKEIKPIKLIKGGKVRAPQSLRYTTYERLKSAKNLDEVFA